MSVRNFVAFDLGAESGRALLGRLDGGRLTLEEKHRFPNPNGRINGHLHWNLLQQWEELKTGLRKSSADVHGGHIQIHGIGVDTWGVDYGLIAPDGDILSNPFHYRDARTDGAMEKAYKIVSKDDIFAATGIQFMQFNTLFQLFSMLDSKKALLSAAKTMLFMPDLLNYLFTGVAKAEFSIASTSQMLDPTTGQWALPLLEKLGIPTHILPPIVPSGTILGQLRADVATECGVPAMPVIAPACHDTASAVAAVPVEGTSDDWCYISSGTWSLMGVEIAKPLINEKVKQYNYTNEGGVGGTIRFLKNIMGLWLVQECRRHWLREGYEHSYSELTQMAARTRGFGAVIDPDHKPFGSPGEMPLKIEQYCRETGQRPPQTRSETVRCCLESLALTYRRTVEGLEDILGRKINTIHIVGGGCQNELLNQMTADATGRKVVAGPIEATAIGNILVQAMATGDIKSLAEAREVVRNSFDVKVFEPTDTKPWEEAYARYRALK
ncbi:rhamnulokinase [Humisphaera borealis]|uniref:Rhamnulokinase n=1 Tax=Humisphaera borealis TaxID=2807512 RepID=A0A7M2WZQ0_9BACT|nr:rhamnulokinase family protein [Humisphaera borealis]QOV89960.1 rhamnulokinase [Humisphaera borealis]